MIPPTRELNPGKRAHTISKLSRTMSANEDSVGSVLEFSPLCVQASIRHMLRVQPTCDNVCCGIYKVSGAMTDS